MGKPDSPSASSTSVGRTLALGLWLRRIHRRIFPPPDGGSTRNSCTSGRMFTSFVPFWVRFSCKTCCLARSRAIASVTTPTSGTSSSTASYSAAVRIDWSDGAFNGTSSWWFWVPQHVEMHDERVSLFSRWMRAGTYEFHYHVRAALPGRYLVAPTVASEMYFPEVFGRTGGLAFEVRP